ncbi:MerR family transcriptional regulator [Lichenihabitans psoromatis]|uniref:MerR family transcriptional regulator n=1 Tax=Lichenihabitans psoromatis TaxID=2528642 RepID=UPI001036B8CD|nr:MerR family transcriptional regulator [Lichenihabitans psoromatis]
MDNAMPTNGINHVLSREDGPFGIDEVAKNFGVTPRTLRFYEQRGLVSPERVNRRRVYKECHIRRLEYVLGQVALGFTLTEIKARLDEARGDHLPNLRTDEIETQLALLKSQKEKLSESIDALMRLRQVLTALDRDMTQT